MLVLHVALVLLLIDTVGRRMEKETTIGLYVRIIRQSQHNNLMVKDSTLLYRVRQQKTNGLISAFAVVES